MSKLTQLIRDTNWLWTPPFLSFSTKFKIRFGGQSMVLNFDINEEH